MINLLLGDCLERLKELPDNSVDSVVTDPPYGLSFMGKKWDYDVPSVDVWKEVFRVLKPGGHCLSFGGTRTYHRLVVAMEDAGFEIRDQLQWIYGVGFPKSLDVSKAIDKAAGAEREVIGENVRISRVAISHGDLSVKVEGTSKGKSKDQSGDRVAVLDAGTSVGDLVKAMNALGVSPKDLITILQNIKAAGALQGELEIL